MSISFQKAFGSFEQALSLRGERASVLANNIANADTPGYKARDMSFHEVLKSRLGEAAPSLSPLQTTQHGHRQTLLEPQAINGLQYRTPSQPAIDGNTVDMQREKAEYALNSLEFQVAFNLLNGRIKGLTSAIRGD